MPSIISLSIYAIQSPLDQISIIRLIDPTNGELIVSFKIPMIPQEKFDLICLFIDVSSILTESVFDVICCQNLTANSCLRAHILSILILLGLGFTFLKLKFNSSFNSFLIKLGLYQVFSLSFNNLVTWIALIG